MSKIYVVCVGNYEFWSKKNGNVVLKLSGVQKRLHYE